jgi:hypothetical protein
MLVVWGRNVSKAAVTPRIQRIQNFNNYKPTLANGKKLKHKKRRSGEPA